MLKLLMIMMFFGAGISQVYAETDSIGIQEINGNQYIVHQIQQGQDLNALSKRYGVTPQQIRNANPEVQEVRVYDYILIPYESGRLADQTGSERQKDESASRRSSERETSGRSNDADRKTHKVEPGETLFRISRMYDVSVESLQEWNNLEDFNISVGDKLFVEPKTEKGDTKAPEAKEKPEEKVEAPDSRESPKDTLVRSGFREVKEEGKAGWLEDATLGEARSLAVHRSAPTGTIIQVKNLMNDKTAYVRVVGQLPDSQANEDLVIKISRAAAEKLDIRDPYFRAELRYADESTP